MKRLIISSRSLFLDCEIKRCIPNPEEIPHPNYRYCRGWDDFDNMGISVCMVHDTHEDRMHVIGDRNRAELARLIELSSQVWTFNGDGFDRRLLKAAWNIEFDDARSCDLQAMILDAVGRPQDDPERHRGFSLEACCRSNLYVGLCKDMPGYMAPRLYQDLDLIPLHNYCSKDVWMLRKLATHISITQQVMQEPGFVSPVDGKKYWIGEEVE